MTEAMDDPSHVQCMVEPDQAGRLDHFLCAQAQFASRGRAQSAIEAGDVLCNGARVSKAGHRVRAGDCISFKKSSRDSAPVSHTLVPDEGPLAVLYDDAEILVLHKPAGVCVHSGAGNPHGTLVERVLAHGISLSPIGLPTRPGVVHRLDKGTSGLMVMAKTEQASLALISQFAEKSVEKRYLAVSIGHFRLQSGTIQNELGRHPVHRQLFSSDARQGKTAITHYRVLSVLGPLSLVELRIETGRTHQIRVHLSELGYPIVGDTRYGGGMKRLRAFPLDESLFQALTALEAADAFLLHAYALAFKHPISGERMSFRVPLPAVFEAFVDSGAWVAYGSPPIP